MWANHISDMCNPGIQSPSDSGSPAQDIHAATQQNESKQS